VKRFVFLQAMFSVVVALIGYGGAFAQTADNTAANNTAANNAANNPTIITTTPTSVESTRKDADGKYVRVGLAVDAISAAANSEARPPKAIFLVLPSVQAPAAGTQLLSPQTLPHEPRHFPMFRNRNALVHELLPWNVTVKL
jgi:hypothetical protein